MAITRASQSADASPTEASRTEHEVGSQARAAHGPQRLCVPGWRCRHTPGWDAGRRACPASDPDTHRCDPPPRCLDRAGAPPVCEQRAVAPETRVDDGTLTRAPSSPRERFPC